MRWIHTHARKRTHTHTHARTHTHTHAHTHTEQDKPPHAVRGWCMIGLCGATASLIINSSEDHTSLITLSRSEWRWSQKRARAHIHKCPTHYRHTRAHTGSHSGHFLHHRKHNTQYIQATVCSPWSNSDTKHYMNQLFLRYCSMEGMCPPAFFLTLLLLLHLNFLP